MFNKASKEFLKQLKEFSDQASYTAKNGNRCECNAKISCVYRVQDNKFILSITTFSSYVSELSISTEDFLDMSQIEFAMKLSRVLRHAKERAKEELKKYE